MAQLFCKICSSVLSSKRRTYPNGRAYYHCGECKTLSLLPPPSKAELAEYYNSLPPNYELALRSPINSRIKFEYFWSKYLDRHLGHIDKTESLLVDVGCFNGDFLSVFQSKGFKKLFGFEINEHACSILQQRGFNFSAEPFWDYSSELTADVVCLFDVIEHIEEPLLAIEKAYSVLKPGGLFLISTPNVSSIIGRVLHRYWPVMDGFEHLYLFSRAGLSRILQNRGFEIIDNRILTKEVTLAFILDMLRWWVWKKKGVTQAEKNTFLKVKVPFGEMFIVAKKSPKGV